MATNDHRPSPLPSTKSTASFWHTQPSPLLLGHRSTRNLPQTVDVVVVGSGITGTSIAHSLLHDENAKDINVLMLEAREACWGATGRNGGHCQPLLYSHPKDPSIASFELANYNIIANLCSSVPGAEFVAQPSVHGYWEETQFAAAKANIASLQASAPHLGNRMRVVSDEAELRKYRVHGALGAVVTGVAARLWPYKLVAAVLEGLLTDARIGKRFNLQTCCAVEQVLRSDKAADGYVWNVSTARGTVRAKKVVLATNGYLSHLLPEYADLVVPCRGQMSALAPGEELSGQHRLQYSYGFLGKSQDDYLIQRPSGKGEQIMFGGGRQFGESIGIADDSYIDPQSEKWLKEIPPKVFGLEKKALEKQMMWSGIMGFSRDEMPWVGPVPGRQGLYVCGGYTGHGMPNAWLCGKATSIMVSHALSGSSQNQEVEAAVDEVKLPKNYLLTQERLEKARTMPTVLAQDHMAMIKSELVETAS